jgi:hypothetical protein
LSRAVGSPCIVNAVEIELLGRKSLKDMADDEPTERPGVSFWYEPLKWQSLSRVGMQYRPSEEGSRADAVVAKGSDWIKPRPRSGKAARRD